MMSADTIHPRRNARCSSRSEINDEHVQRRGMPPDMTVGATLRSITPPLTAHRGSRYRLARRAAISAPTSQDPDVTIDEDNGRSATGERQILRDEERSTCVTTAGRDHDISSGDCLGGSLRRRAPCRANESRGYRAVPADEIEEVVCEMQGHRAADGPRQKGRRRESWSEGRVRGEVVGWRRASTE